MGLKKDQQRQIDLSWAAGFFDGEGCTTGGFSRNNHLIQMAVSQKNREPLEKFRKIARMGYIFKRKQKKGRLPGAKSSFIFIWRISDFRLIQFFFNEMRPYLSQVKIVQAMKVVMGLEKYYENAERRSYRLLL